MPLTNSLQNQRKKNSTLIVSSNELVAFNNAKETLINYTKLSYIEVDENAKLTLTTDASADTIGALLYQEDNGRKQTLSFFSFKRKTT